MCIRDRLNLWECGCYSQKCSYNVFHGPEARLEGMGQNTPTTAPSSSSRTPFLFQLLTGHRKSTNNPHKKHTAPTRPKWAQLHCHHSTSQHKQQLISLPAWVEQLHLLTTTPTSRLHCLSSSRTVDTIPPDLLAAMASPLTPPRCFRGRGTRSKVRPWQLMRQATVESC